MCFFSIAFLTARAQVINLDVYSAYVFDDKFDSYYNASEYYKGKIKGGYQWGAGIEYRLRPDYGVELLYIGQNTNAPTEYAGNGSLKKYTNFDLGVRYILLGGLRYFGSPGKKVEGFAGMMGGLVAASLKNPDNGRSSSAEKFSWGVRAGGVVWAKENVGIKLQIQLLSAVQSMGGGFYFGTGGSGAGLSAYSTIYQLSVGGGLVLRMRS